MLYCLNKGKFFSETEISKLITDRDQCVPLESKRGHYSTHTCNIEGFIHERGLMLRITGRKKKRKELMSFINGRFFYNAGRKFPNGECKELRRIKNSKKLMQVEVVQSPAKKRGRKQG